MNATGEDEIVVRREGRAGWLTLNRPKALNALTYGMVTRLWQELNAWAVDPAVDIVLLDGAGERALCAGGDVRSLYESRVQGSQFARRFWSDEYRLNALIKSYPKPFVAIQDGIVMGGGIGVSAHASHRIVTERSHLAMPETTIGLIPDVGGTWLLGHAPGESGAYLGLSSAPMTAADAIYAKFSDTYVPSTALADLKTQICDANAGSIDAVIARFAGNPGQSTLAQHAAEIDAAFAAESVTGVIERLKAMPGAFAEHALKSLAAKSPKAMQLTLAAIHQARRLPSLDAALEVEYRLVCRLFEDGEFPEGVRALIVDKDRKPKWSPASLAELPDDLVARYLAPMPEGEALGLARLDS